METKIKAILVDDEERARNTLSLLLKEFCPNVELLAKCENVPDAIESIKNLQPELVFLDIEMPDYNGFELFDLINEINFETIFVTAYDQYAIKAFEVSAIDYLLKPVEIESLQKAVEKVNKKVSGKFKEQVSILKNIYRGEDIKKIAIPLSDGISFFDLNDIILFSADGAYTNVFFKNKTKLLVSKRLKFFEDLLENREVFFRAHRSSMINVNYLKKYNKGQSIILLDNNEEIQISRDRKNDFENLLKELNILF